MEKIVIPQKFKVKEFINMFLQLFLNVNKIFNEIRLKQKEIQIFYKAENEKFTTLDWTIQKMVENYFDKYFPGINLIGEEDTKKEYVKSDYSELLTKVEEITINPVTNDLFCNESPDFDFKDISVYLDPIDGTNSFIKGKYEEVSVLVGVTYKQIPVLGLMHFLSFENKHPVTFFNIPNNGVYSLTVNNEEVIKAESANEYKNLKFIVKIEPPEIPDNWNFLITASRETPVMKQSKNKKLKNNLFF